MHSFSYYFKRGNALAKLLFSKRSFFDKMLLAFYFVGALFGKLFFFTRPIFLIADMNIALMLNEGHDVEVNKIFEGVNDKKRYSSLLLSSLFIDIILYGALIVLVVPMLMLGIFGPFESAMVIVLVISILGSVIMVVMQIALTLTYIPMGFVATKGVNLSCGDVLYLSKKASKGNKGLIVGLYVLYNLFIYIIVLAIGGLVFLFFTLAINESELLIIPACILLLSVPVFEIFVFSRIRVALVSSLYALYSDSIEVKHVVISKRASSSFEEYVALFSDDMEEK